MTWKLYKDSENRIYSYPADESQDHLIGDKVLITQAEADAIVESNFAPIREQILSTMSYAQKRALEYPPVAEQLDAFWKGGADAESMRALIQEIKSKYPKPSGESP
jgi:hypothetical protein